MRRFFVDASDVQGDSIFITVKSDVNHIINVLRMNVGDRMLISDKTEYEYTCEIRALGKNEIEVDIIEKSVFKGEPEIHITLFQGVPKSSKMDTIIQKSIELGANSIIPFVSSRSAATKVSEISTSKIERWRRISSETVKQCRRGIIPEIANPISVKSIAQEVADYDLVVVLYELEESVSLKEALVDFKNRSSEHPKIALVVGPEGGIDSLDVEEIVSAGAKSVTVGKRILRTETAGPAAIAMLLYEFEL